MSAISTALIDAVLDDDRASVKKLLKAYPSLATAVFTEPRLFQNKIFHWLHVGDTALHLAAAGYRVEIVRLLLDAGADVNSAKNHRRGHPLHYAADGRSGEPDWREDKQLETIHALLDAGAEIDAQDKNGATALHRAVRTRCFGAVECLLERGADPKIKNEPGSTVFHLAVQNTGRGGSGSDNAKIAQRKIVQAFLDAGLSPKLKDAKGKTVLDWARSNWIREMLS
jgi:ankyrin repeat protein